MSKWKVRLKEWIILQCLTCNLSHFSSALKINFLIFTFNNDNVFISKRKKLDEKKTFVKNTLKTFLWESFRKLFSYLLWPGKENEPFFVFGTFFLIFLARSSRKRKRQKNRDIYLPQKDKPSTLEVKEYSICQLFTFQTFLLLPLSYFSKNFFLQGERCVHALYIHKTRYREGKLNKKPRKKNTSSAKKFSLQIHEYLAFFSFSLLLFFSCSLCLSPFSLNANVRTSFAFTRKRSFGRRY